MYRLRTVWVYAVGLVLTAFWSLRILGHKLVGSKSFARVIHDAPRQWSSGILRAAGVRVRYENLERLPQGRAQILVANHESWFDVFALAATLPVDYRFVGKQELARIPVFGPAWLAAGHYSIDRSDRQAAIGSLDRVGRRMKEGGHTVVLFPEGTRSADGRLGPFKKGAFVMAINAGVPVVPVAIRGSRQIMPKGRWTARGGEIVVRVGESISTEGYGVEDRDALTRVAKGRIEALKEGPLPGRPLSGGGTVEPDEGAPPEPEEAAWRAS